MAGILGRLDPEQRAAVALRRNGAVSAGAGSGKTTVLAARYLDLVLREGADLRSILCLTFTRKAAAEMRARVRRELAASGEPAALAQLERFPEAAISTIDAFCGSVLRACAQDYGYAPDFRVDDEACALLAEREALAFLLERREEGAMPELLARLGFEPAWRGLFAPVGARFSTPAERAGEGLLDSIPKARRALAAGLAAAQEAMEAARSALLGLEGLRSAKALQARASVEGLAPLGAAARAWPSPDPGGPERLGPPPEDLAAAAERFAACNLSAFGRSGTELEAKEALGAARTAARRWLGLERARRQTELREAAIRLLDDFSRRLLAVKREAGIMGFRDVAVAAAHRLASCPEARAPFRDRFRYVMVDEFQDDDELQKELLYAIAEDPAKAAPGAPGAERLAPDKLFFVGDDKQSIYRFRGAEVAVFNRLGRELAAAAPVGGDAADAAGATDVEAAHDGEAERGPEAFPRLAANYRSEPALVDFCNRLFEGVFSGAVEDFEARHAPARARAATPGLLPDIRLLWKPRSPLEGAEGYRSGDEAFAAGLVDRIARAVGPGGLRVPLTREELAVAAGGGGAGGDGGSGALATRPARWDDIAVLLRSGTKQFLLERFLRLRGIPYSSGTLRSLYLESPANDLYAALRLALSPDDRPAYAAFLRSPFCGLDDDALVPVLASGRPPFDDRDSDALGEIGLTGPSPAGSGGGAAREGAAREGAAREGAAPGGSAAGEEGGGARRNLAAWRRGAATYAGARERADLLPHAELVAWLWHERGLRLSLLARPESHPYLEHYDYLFALAAEADRRGEGLAAFLARLEPLMGKPEKLEDLEVQKEAARGVRIMTIHKSKGLEFPIVVLPWLEGEGRSGGAGKAFYLSREAGLTLNLRPYDEPGAGGENAFYLEAKERDEAEEAAEAKRLFYVACTRATSHLLLASRGPRGKAPGKDSFLALLARGGASPEPGPGEAAPGASAAEAARVAGSAPEEAGPGFPLPPGLALDILPELEEEAYLGLLARGRRPSAAAFAAAYRARRLVDRARPPRRLAATALARAGASATPADGAEGATTRAALAALPVFDGLAREQAEAFPESSFGELCHALLEAALRGVPPEPPPRAALELLEALPERLRAPVLEEARSLARGFLESPFGRETLAFPRLEAEKEYLLALPDAAASDRTEPPRASGPRRPWLVSCRADLVAESAGEIRVVDFKSDRRRESAAHAVQLALYRRAILGSLGRGGPSPRVRSYLFWLRAGEAEELAEGPDEAGLAALCRAAAAEAGNSGAAGNSPAAEDPP